ncbi:MAG: alpha/beta fold hydrolase, partial [Solirubrobacterales bacterium]|nr:alpha/beta fold hydrolase [Solirubrobacterales bacterium]
GLFSIGAIAATRADAAGRRGHDREASVTCRQDVRLPVALAAGEPASYTVSGELCSTATERRDRRTLQLLIPGATYDHRYWDFGTIDGRRYSYARDAAALGYPTFALDMLGTGDSSTPLSDQITIDTAAFVAHQAVQALRDGRVAGIRFGKVIEVGHSLNSIAVWQEAITYQDVNGVIVTGAAHSITARFAQLAGTDFYPAAMDPSFAGRGLDPGWLTTVPGTRGTLFYSPVDADPAVIAADEATKGLASATELNTGVPLVPTNGTLAIHVPVLDILGSNDLTTCGPNPQGQVFDCSSGAAVAAQEAPFYSPEAHIHGCVIPGSGHDISLALNNWLQVDDAVRWSNAYVGTGRGRRDNDGLPRNCG